MNEPAMRVEAQPMEPAQPAGLTPMEMLSHAVERGADISVLEKLMSLQERWERNQGRKAFDHAIAAAKSEIQPIVKNRTVDFTSSKGRTHYQHEDLAQIARQVDPILAAHGLSYRYRTEQDGATVMVTCILSHRDGYSEETTLSGGPDQSGNKNSYQQVGSAVTYLQRYTLKAALGLAASNDDDGRSASKDAGPISAEQFQKIRDRMGEIGINEDKLLAYLGAEHLEELPASKFDAAMDAINTSKQAQEKRQKGGADA